MEKSRLNMHSRSWNNSVNSHTPSILKVIPMWVQAWIKPNNEINSNTKLNKINKKKAGAIKINSIALTSNVSGGFVWTNILKI